MQKVTFINSEEFQPTQNFILVKPKELEEELKTESGIVFSLNANNSVMDRPTYGEVIAVGPENDHVKQGDFIFWPQTDGLDFEFKDGEFKLIQSKSVIGIQKC